MLTCTYAYMHNFYCFLYTSVVLYSYPPKELTDYIQPILTLDSLLNPLVGSYSLTSGGLTSNLVTHFLWKNSYLREEEPLDLKMWQHFLQSQTIVQIHQRQTLVVLVYRPCECSLNSGSDGSNLTEARGTQQSVGGLKRGLDHTGGVEPCSW